MLTEELYKEIFSELLQESVAKNAILEAMKNRWPCNITYNDGTQNAATGTRKVEFFCYGLSHHGHDVVRAWQEGGDSKTSNGKKGSHDPLKRIAGWRFFRVDRITHVEFIKNEGQFSTNRPKYNKDDKHMSDIYYAVDSKQSGGSSSVDTRVPVNPVDKDGAVDTRLASKANAAPNSTSSPVSVGASIRSDVKSGTSELKGKFGGIFKKGKNNTPKKNIYESLGVNETPEENLTEGELFLNEILQNYL